MIKYQGTILKWMIWGYHHFRKPSHLFRDEGFSLQGEVHIRNDTYYAENVTTEAAFRDRKSAKIRTCHEYMTE